MIIDANQHNMDIRVCRTLMMTEQTVWSPGTKLTEGKSNDLSTVTPLKYICKQIQPVSTGMGKDFSKTV